MNNSQRVVAATLAVSLLAFGTCQAAEAGKPSAASRAASKARDYATRDDKEGPADVAAAATTAVAGQKAGDGKMPALDSPAVDKAAKETGDNWKKLDKVLDRF